MLNEQTVLTSIHVLAAVLLVGAIFATNVAMALAVRAGEPARLKATLQLLVALGKVLPLLMVIILATGIWLTADYYDFGDLWISLGLAGLLIAFSVGVFYLRPNAHAMLAALEQGGGPPPGGPGMVPVVARLNFLLLIAVVVIMVIRPT